MRDLEELKMDVKAEAWREEPLSVFVFGASGDLAKKKTYPSLLDLYVDDLLPKQTIIVGYARSKVDEAAFKTQLVPFLEKRGYERRRIDGFLDLCIYRSGQYDSEEVVKNIAEEATHLQKYPPVENRIFYFALPPNAFMATAVSVKRGAMTANGFNRVIVEKPFGHDTESAEMLSAQLGGVFDEAHLYRIDHYLGKEMVQNLIVLRFGNSWLEPLWNNKFVKAVVISFKEDIGTTGRGGYFDKSGIIRDIMQNHLMQVLSIVAMEPPTRVVGDGHSDIIRDEKVKVLNCVEPWSAENTVLGQYIGNGDEPGYLDDESVPEGSNCPTYACTVMQINNPRWQGVPFIMKAGKALNERRAEVRLQLKSPPGGRHMFGVDDEADIPYNEIVIRLQPNESIYVKTNVKRPGLHTEMVQSELDLSYHLRYKEAKNPDAYTRLLLDVLRGKQATFVRKDELIAAWKIATPLLKEIETKNIQPTAYMFGTRGPKEADVLVRKAGYLIDPNYSWGK